MVVDWTQPIEFDDGQQAVLLSQSNDWGPKTLYQVTTVDRTGDASRTRGYPFTKGWWYTPKGIFEGGNARDWRTIRNVTDQPHTFIPEDWS